MTSKDITNQINSQIATPDTLAQEFLRIKAKREQVAELKKALDTEYNEIREKLLDTTRGLGVKTLKTDAYLLKRVSSKTYRVVDENKAITSMKEMGLEPLMKLDYYANLPTFKAIPIDGVEETVIEYVSITATKKVK